MLQSSDTPPGIHVVAARSAPQDGVSLDQLRLLVSRHINAEQARRYERLRDAADKSRFLTARLCAVAALASAAEVPQESILIGATRKGCPVPLEPFTTRGYRISMSHSFGLCVASAGKTMHGIDAEPLHRSNRVWRIVSQVFTAREIGTCHSKVAVIRTWTGKEAIAKALGTGFRFDPKRIRVLPRRNGDWPEPTSMTFSICYLSTIDGYVTALASLGRRQYPVITKWIDMRTEAPIDSMQCVSGGSSAVIQASGNEGEGRLLASVSRVNAWGLQRGQTGARKCTESRFYYSR